MSLCIYSWEVWGLKWNICAKVGGNRICGQFSGWQMCKCWLITMHPYACWTTRTLFTNSGLSVLLAIWNLASQLPLHEGNLPNTLNSRFGSMVKYQILPEIKTSGCWEKSISFVPSWQYSHTIIDMFPNSFFLNLLWDLLLLLFCWMILFLSQVSTLVTAESCWSV